MWIWITLLMHTLKYEISKFIHNQLFAILHLHESKYLRHRLPTKIKSLLLAVHPQILNLFVNSPLLCISLVQLGCFCVHCFSIMVYLVPIFIGVGLLILFLCSLNMLLLLIDSPQPQPQKQPHHISQVCLWSVIDWCERKIMEMVVAFRWKTSCLHKTN